LLSADVQTDDHTSSSKNNTINFHDDPWNSKDAWMNVEDIRFDKNLLDGLSETGWTEDECVASFGNPKDQDNKDHMAYIQSRGDHTHSRVLKDIKMYKVV
jgi:hypothetical protein